MKGRTENRVDGGDARPQWASSSFSSLVAVDGYLNEQEAIAQMKATGATQYAHEDDPDGTLLRVPLDANGVTTRKRGHVLGASGL